MKNERNQPIVFVMLFAPVFCLMLMGIATSSLGEVVIYETDFDPDLPGDWEIVDGYFDGNTWASDDPYGLPDNLTAPYMIVDSASAGEVDMDERLISPSVNCSIYVKVKLKYKNNFRRDVDGNEIGYVDVRIEGGSWQHITWYDTYSEEDVVEDISSIAAGQEDVQISWHYYNANNDLYWAIDDVQILGTLPRTIYVDQDAPGNNDGSSWFNAYIDLQDALDNAIAGDIIRVAQGEYKPDRGTQNRDSSFYLIPQVSIRGGYAGFGEPDPNQRDIQYYPTILTGDLLGNDGPDFTGLEDNSYHVVQGYLVDDSAILDGFVIKGGNAYFDYGAGILNWGASPTITNCTFIHNYAGWGAGICNLFSSSPTLTECTVRENRASHNGGGLYNFSHSNPALDHCLFQANRAGIDGGGIYSYGGNTVLSNCTIIENSATGHGGGINQNRGTVICNDCIVSNNQAAEGGEIYNTPDSAMYFTNAITKDPNFIHEVYIGGTMAFQQNTKVRSGYFVIKEQGVLLFEDDTCLTLEDRGSIVSHGTLWARGRALIEYTHIEVTRMHFDEQAIIFNNVINAEAGSPYGQFYIEESVRVVMNQIRADGDRYLDLDPYVFDGLVENNQIYITITEGVGNTQGGLLELRGEDGLADHVCDPNMFLCQVDPNTIPDCNQVSWTIEELHIIDDAKLNLANRFDFQPPYDSGGENEVLYVKKIILGKRSILNTAFHRIYYEALEADPNAVITHQPLLGFSLHNITFDNEIDYATRVTHNNCIHPDDPNLNRIHVERITAQPPDLSGMMKMINLLDQDPNSSTYETLVRARAKGLFAKSSEDRILILFEYLFCSPGTQLDIYLTDVPELLENDDPNLLEHYLHVARLPAPPPGRPGSVGSGRFGVFEKIVSTGNLRFTRGTRIEFELIGPEGSYILINNWDPQVKCNTYCLDVTGEDAVTIKDYLTVTGETGQFSDDLNILGQLLGCLDAPICKDGYININDILIWDWLTYLSKEHDLGSFCYFDVPPTQTVKSSSSLFNWNSWYQESTSASGIDKMRGDLIIAAKRFVSGQKNDYASDQLYSFDRNGNFLGGPEHLTFQRANGRLVRDYAGEAFYQINLEKGLIHLSDEEVVVEPGTRAYRKADPWYDKSGVTVHLGLHGQVDKWWGRPILDAAFDRNGNLYVLPVVVEPQGKRPYLAAAKLILDPNEYMTYVVDQLYGEPPLWNENQDPNQLREIEVDYEGNVYILNNYHINESDILWVYNNVGELQNSSRICLSHPDIGIQAPTALCLSQFDDSTIYMASSLNEPNATSSIVYALPRQALPFINADQIREIRIDGIGHVTSISEDPATGTLWVAGFTMAEIPLEVSTNEDPFYSPYLAKVSYNCEYPNFVRPLYEEHVCDLRLPISVLWTEKRCGGADLDYSSQVNSPDLHLIIRHWLETSLEHEWQDEIDLDGSGSIDLVDFAILAQHWLETKCK